jgi:hypothetical protein
MNVPLMEETKVHYGIARAHQMMLTINNYIESADLNSLDCLLSWKERRRQLELDPVLGKASVFENTLFLYHSSWVSHFSWIVLFDHW